MGCGTSSIDHSIDNVPYSTKKTLHTIKLDNDDIEGFHVLYVTIKKKAKADVKTESLTVYSVLNHFGLETVTFMFRCLSFFNIVEQNTDIIEDFRAFTFSVWNFLTLDDELLLDFAFYLYGDMANNIIKVTTLIRMVREIYGVNAETVFALRLFAKIDTALSKVIFNRKEFGEFSLMNAPLLAPIHVIQLKWRKKLFGVKRWTKYCSKRSTISESLFDATGESNITEYERNDSMALIKVNCWVTSGGRTMSQQISAMDMVMDFNESNDNPSTRRPKSRLSKSRSVTPSVTRSYSKKRAHLIEHDKLKLSTKTSWTSDEVATIELLQPRESRRPLLREISRISV